MLEIVLRYLFPVTGGMRQDSGLVQDEVLEVGLSLGQAAWQSASVW